jgi:hypothetical protein
MVFLFFLIFLVAWAGGVWLPPFGPVLLGGHWLPILFTAFLVVLLLLALIPPRPPRSRREAIQQAEQQMGSESALGVFFWILVIGLSIAIIVHYLR